jgi:hypothetical protein
METVPGFRRLPEDDDVVPSPMMEWVFLFNPKHIVDLSNKPPRSGGIDWFVLQRSILGRGKYWTGSGYGMYPHIWQRITTKKHTLVRP